MLVYYRVNKGDMNLLFFLNHRTVLLNSSKNCIYIIVLCQKCKLKGYSRIDFVLLFNFLF